MDKNQTIDITSIQRAPRYLFTVDYIFPNPYSTVATFEKKNVATTGLHVQEFYEICIISKGEGYHIIEDTCVNAVKGDVFVVPPGRKHALVGGDGFNIFYIHLSPAFFKHYTSKMKILPAFLALFEIEPTMRAHGTKYRHLYLDDNALNETIGILRGGEKRYQYDPATMLILESYIVIVLTILCREYEKMQTIISKNANIDRHFMNSISLILESYNQKITIEYLAQVAGLSRTTYIERFRKAMGMSPRRFIMQQRLKAAKELLVSTNTPIIKVAEETGFYDSAHFNKCFIASEKIAPSEYRKTAQNSNKLENSM